MIMKELVVTVKNSFLQLFSRSVCDVNKSHSTSFNVTHYCCILHIQSSRQFHSSSPPAAGLQLLDISIINFIFRECVNACRLEGLMLGSLQKYKGIFGLNNSEVTGGIVLSCFIPVGGIYCITHRTLF